MLRTAACALVSLAVLSGVAHGQDRLADSKQLVQEGKFEQALQKLLPAFAQGPSGELAYLIGRCYDGLRDRPRALRFYQTALGLGGLSETDKNHITRRMNALRKRLKNQPRKATLSVVTNAPGALVRLDGREVGRTPLSGLLIGPGRHVLTLEKEGFEPWTKEFTAQVWETKHFDVKMQDKPTSILISTEPAGAIAKIEDGPQCITPCLVSLRSGTYQLTIERPGHETLRQKIVKAPGKLLEVKVRLVAKDTKGHLRLVIDQPGAIVMLNGREVGRSPIADLIPLPPGTHQLSVAKEGFRAFLRPVDIQTGKTAELVIELAPDGTIETDDPEVTTGSSSYRWTKMRIAGVATLATGGAMIITALALTIDVVLKKQSFETATRFKIEDRLYVSGLTRQQVVDLEDAAKKESIASGVMWGLGGAAVVTGLVLMLLKPSKGDVFTAPSLSLRPTLGVGEAGVSATVRF